ncbi:hypothetical protein BZZ01_05290 [Nostocales cyanobacterium HT-58-2]|nr:hypothetical protein BZZ01_05290 [Nostocales cyanobacterium HT-58-2]
MVYASQGEPKVMNSAKLEQLQKEIQQAVYNGLDNSPLVELLAGYGLTDRVIQIHVIVDLDKIRLTNAIKDPEIKDSLQAIPGHKLVITGCDWCTQGCCG